MFKKFSKFEDVLINKFNQHPLWAQLPKRSNAFFIRLLLQLGCISNHFVMWYEQAKLGINIEFGKELIRSILRDEVSRNLPTHQDNRLYDLIEKIGISKKLALSVKPSPTTQKTIKKLFNLVRYPQSDYDLRVLVSLRIAGEVLVAETYRHIVPALTTRFSIKPRDSKFYYPHFKHDAKDAKGHTDSFDKILKSLIIDERTLAIAKASAKKAFAIRLAFYDQFV